MSDKYKDYNENYIIRCPVCKYMNRVSDRNIVEDDCCKKCCVSYMTGEPIKASKEKKVRNNG